MSFEMIDAVVLAGVFSLLVLIVRGMIKGRIRACECGSCSGECASCSAACEGGGLKLSSAQMAQLQALRAEREERA